MCLVHARPLRRTVDFGTGCEDHLHVKAPCDLQDAYGPSRVDVKAVLGELDGVVDADDRCEMHDHIGVLCDEGEMRLIANVSRLAPEIKFLARAMVEIVDAAHFVP